MRSLAVGLGALWLVVGCTVPPDAVKTCTTDADCQGGLCDTSQGLCYADRETDAGQCTPACTEYEACTTGGCRPRFTALNILTPADSASVNAGPVEVSARLVPSPVYASTTQFPDTLLFTATASASGGGTGSFGPVTRSGDTYTALWTPPSAQGSFTLTAAHPVPGAGKSSSVTVRVDTVPPSFTLAFSAPPARAAGSATTQADERDPALGYETAFRRDESVTVTVSASEPVSGVLLTVVGIGPGGSAGQAQPPVQVQPGSGCSNAPAFCGTATVALSVPEMKDGRGTMDFRVEGVDAAGNRGTASAGLKVTRWKWAFEAGGRLLSTPAIGQWGTVYFGTSTGTNTGMTFAVKTDGGKRWEAPTGDVGGSVAVGVPSSSDEYVYVAGRTSAASSLYAFFGSNGTEKARCAEAAGATEVLGALGVGPQFFANQTLETAMGSFDATDVRYARISGIRPDAPSPSQCTRLIDSQSTPIPPGAPGGAFVMKDSSVFYGTTAASPGPRVTAYIPSSISSQPNSGWPQSLGQVTRGLALSGDQLYGSAASTDNPPRGGVFRMSAASGGTPVQVYPASGTSRVFNLSLGGNDSAYFGAETSLSADFVSLNLGSGASEQVTGASVMRGAPVVGKNGRVYTLDTLGGVTAWSTNPLARLWKLELSQELSTRDVSPTMDCRRDSTGNTVAGPGTLYIAAGTKLFALIVEEPGLDPSAPWPKYQHDVRNSGNPATPITACP